MKVDYEIAMEVASHEALIRQTYKDSVGVLTWCVGMTNATGHTVERYINNPASVQHCMNVYTWALENYAEGVRRAFDGHVLIKAQFAAAGFLAHAVGLRLPLAKNACAFSDITFSEYPACWWLRGTLATTRIDSHNATRSASLNSSVLPTAEQ